MNPKMSILKNKGLKMQKHLYFLKTTVVIQRDADTKKHLQNGGQNLALVSTASPTRYKIATFRKR